MLMPTSMRLLLVTILAAAGSLELSAQPAAPKSKRRAAKPQIIAPEPTYENVQYGPWDRNVLDVWVPEATQPTPMIVFIHGGGFVGGNKEQVRRTKNVQQALDHGVAFASIQYRFRYADDDDTTDPQRTGIQNILRDSARAIQFLRHRAGDYNLDPSRIACYGGSAGAGTSIWLAFHDDLADPDNSDPVLRQSSRIAAAGMLNGQFSYDLEQWDKEFASRGGNLLMTHGREGKLELHKFFGLSQDEYFGPAGQAARADVDMRAMISADDPPVFIQTGNADQPPRTRGIYNHHPLHAELIEQRCKDCGVNVLCLLSKVRQADAARLTSNPDVMMDFFFDCLAVKTGEPGNQNQQTQTKVALRRADPASVGVDPARLGQVKPALQKFVDDQKIAGAVVAVARRGKLILFDAVGMKDVDTATPMTTDTVFRIYSMSKPITSVAAMTLVEEGKLKLEDPVANYIPQFGQLRVFVSKEGDQARTEPLRRAVTIRDLLRHTSGLTYGFFGDSAVDKMYRKAAVFSNDDDNESLAIKVAGIPLMNQPGTAFQYGVSVDVLGRVIEVVSGQPLDDFLQQRIFDPLKMRDTGFFVGADSHDRFATNYTPGDGGDLALSNAPASSQFLTKPKMLSGGGGLVSTAGDYLRFGQMMLDGGQLEGVRILQRETIELMTSDQLPKKAFPVSVGGSEFPGVGFGLGFSVVVDQQQPPWTGLAGEYGWDGMASTHYWASADKELVVVVLAQRVPYSAQLENAVKPIIYAAITD